ncbi:MAG: hypothetical protein AB1782_05880, partial [Cyanobacteriota bacterium]
FSILIKTDILSISLIILVISSIFVSCNTYDKSQKDTDIFEDIDYCEDKIGNKFYSIYTNSTNNVLMEKYAKDKVYVPGKKTSVYFFDNKDHIPSYKDFCSDKGLANNNYLIYSYRRLPDGSYDFKYGI